MASFRLSPTSEELRSSGEDRDESLHIWTFSTKMGNWPLAKAFLDAGYSNRYRGKRMYWLERRASHCLMVRFRNPLDAVLLYGHGHHCACEMVVFTRLNGHTNYWDQFPGGRNIHIVRYRELPTAPELVLAPPGYYED